MRDSDASHHLEVHAFLILERVVDSKEFLVSVLLQADGRFIGQTSLGIVAEGQEILLSLSWDQPLQRFVASSQVAGNGPILSFIPFALPGTADPVPADFSMAKHFVLSSSTNNYLFDNPNSKKKGPAGGASLPAE